MTNQINPAPPPGAAASPAALRLRMLRRTTLIILGIVLVIGGSFYWLDVRNKRVAGQRSERARAHVILRPGEETQDWRLKEGARVEELAKTIQKQNDQLDGLRGELEGLRKQQKLEREAEQKRRAPKERRPGAGEPPVPPLGDILPPPSTPSLKGSSKPPPPKLAEAPRRREPPEVRTEGEPSEEAPRITVPPSRPAPPGARPPTAKPPAAAPAAGTPGAGRLRVITPRAETRGVPRDMQTVGWLPSGSFIHGSLLSGVDAGTGTGRSLPYPVLIRLREPGILPNRFKMDLAECFVIGAAFGDLPSERVYIRSETLSCLRKGGGILTIDGELKGHAIGEDGKLGLRGRIVSKEGTLIARSLMAGFLSGLGEAFRPRITYAPLQLGGTTTDQSFQLPPLGDTLAAAGLSGVGRSMELLARHYLQQAQNLYPVIEIDAGRQVDIVVLKGMALKFNVQRAAAAAPTAEIIE